MIYMFSKKIARWLTLHSNKNPLENIEVYTYGLECFFNTTITSLLLLLLGYIFHSILGIIIWMLCFTRLRNHIGGYHAPTQLACITLSTITGYSSIILAHSPFFSSFKIISIFYIISFAFCLLCAPLNNDRKPLSNAEQKKERNISLLLLVITYTLSILLPKPYSNFVTLSTIDTILLAVISLLS